MANSRNQKLRIGWVIALIALAIGYRVFAVGNSDLANTSPLMAMAFGGGLLLGLRFWWVPAALLVISDVALGFSAGTGVGSYTLLTSLCYTAAAFAGGYLGKNRGSQPGQWPKMWLGTMVCSLLFYAIANSFVWALSPAYAKTVAGWWQSQTVGLPGWAPSIFFLRNALIGDTIWCVVAAPLFFWNALSIPRAAPVSE